MEMLFPGGADYVALLATTIVVFLFGFIWYSPGVFGKTWMKLVGVSEGKKEDMPKTMLMGFLNTLVGVYVVWLLMGMVNLGSTQEAFMFGFILWLGFQATMLVGGCLWEKKPVQLFWLNGAYYLLAIWITILVLMNWKW